MTTTARTTPTLRLGAHGTAVKTLQAELKAAGYDCGPVDGVFGAQTEKAVRSLQAKRHLARDGVVGQQTWHSLMSDSYTPGQPSPKPPTHSTTPSPTVGGTRPHTGNAFIDSVAAGAVEGQQKYGVPASVTIAQAILESGWGKSGLTQKAHNLFGIKGTGPAGSVTVPTQEYVHGKWITIDAAFRAYHSNAESLADHAKLLGTSGYYTHAMSVKRDPNAFANALTGVYATAPNYGKTLISIMKQYDLYRFD
jgi:flagellum-specific peptidoglycan hydrolase FlgJ